MKQTNWQPWHFVTRKLSTSDWLYPAPKDEIEARHAKIRNPLFISTVISIVALFYSTSWMLPIGMIAFTITFFLLKCLESYRYLSTPELEWLSDIERRFAVTDPGHLGYRVTQILKPLMQQQGFVMCGQLRAAKKIAQIQIDEELGQSRNK